VNMRRPFFRLFSCPLRLPLMLMLATLALLAGCKPSNADRVAAIAASEKSLAMSPTLFATRFNRSVREVLDDRHDDEAARMAPLFVMDVTSLTSDDQRYVLKTAVGPARTPILGALARDGDLRSVGALLTQRSEGAREEFYLCAEIISRVFTEGANDKLLDIIKRLTTNALNNPGQKMSQNIGDKVLSVDIVQSGLLFQIEHQQ